MKPRLGWSVPARVGRIGVTLVGSAIGRRELGQALPHFLLLGAMKAGTSSLFAAIAAHPQVITPRRREIHFFGRKYRNGVPWYRRHFPTGLELGPDRITGEGSTSYLANAAAPARIREQLPQVKLIAILRDPVERAISNYFHEQRTGREHLSIEEAFDQEAGRLEKARAGQKGLGIFAYKERGIYADQITRYLELFPRHQLLILKSEAFFANPGETVNRAFGFLGLDPELARPDLHRRNPGSYDSDQVPSRVLDNLTSFFTPHNTRLYRILGSDWGWRRDG
jgi:hypothetical protein